MAIIKACSFASSVKNTGKECDVSMVAPAMIICVPRSYTFTDTDLLDPDAWLDTLIHAAITTRAFPLFGQQAPIREVTNDQASDVIVELGDGLKVFLRYGMYNRTLETTSGGICYAKALQSFNKSGYSIIEIDQQGQMLCRDNGNGTYSGLIIDFMYAPSPVLADFKNTPWKSRFQYSFSPVELVGNGIILEGATSLLDKMGLIDAVLTNSATTQTTTTIFFGVKTECAETDLVALLGAPLGTFANNFVVTNKATGAVITPSAAAIVGGEIRLTGVFATGQTFYVVGSAPSQWKTNGAEGYDASAIPESRIEIPIP